MAVAGSKVAHMTHFFVLQIYREPIGQMYCSICYYLTTFAENTGGAGH